MLKGKKRIYLIIPLLVVMLYWLFCLPEQLFVKPTSTVLLARDGSLLAANISSDGQWRFPPSDSVPKKFEICLTTFEDKGFRKHWGISPKAIIRAGSQNLQEGEIISGASTITMQLMRMARERKGRSFVQKAIEIVWATRTEMRYTKDEILGLYADNAPFGGNVVGLNAAAWRYYNKPAYSLTWAESAVLAVLPNAPGLIYPGRNPNALKQKRDFLLGALLEEGYIDRETYNLSLLEELPGKPYPLPLNSTHLLAAAQIKYGGKTIQTSLNAPLQNNLSEVLGRHLKNLESNHIHNGAILVADTETGEILAYIGNGNKGLDHMGMSNDMILAPRSSGSILKPFLYAAMLGDAFITPDRLVADVPTQYGGFAPKNFDGSYSGAVPASEALARSLNIPAVRMLKDYGVSPFADVLQNCGFSTVDKAPEYYGLSLILGGAEVRLIDLVSAYRLLGKQVLKYPGPCEFNKVTAFGDTTALPNWPIGTAVAYSTLEAMTMVTRPDEETGWEAFGDGTKIAWKTGTSYGFRDAWALGISPKYTVGIWVGNATGEGRPGITGLHAAAPVLFDVFNHLEASQWFEPPARLLAGADICCHSGMIAGRHCKTIKRKMIPKAALQTISCSYCRSIILDQSKSLRVNANCADPEEMICEKWFVLSPLEEWFYKKRYASYRSLPPFKEGCGQEEMQSMALIYPHASSQVLLPRELGGVREKIVLKAAHQRSEATIFWHLGNEYIGQTQGFHHLEVDLEPGTHNITLIDDTGQSLSSILQVVAN